MRALVTGGAGHVGHHLIRLLEERGASIVAVDCAEHAYDLGNVRWLKRDLSDPRAFDEAIRLAQPDALFHVAGLTADAPVVELYRANVVGTACLAEAVARAGRPEMRIVFVSSSAVYGAANQDPIDETSPHAPASHYGLSKSAGEGMLLVLRRDSGQWIAIARPFNIVGPGQRAQLLPTIVARRIAQIERGECPAILELGRLANFRDFVDVRDVAAGLVAMAEFAVSGEAYNLCSGNAVQASTIVDLLVSMSRRRIEVRAKELPPSQSDVARQCGSPAKARALGWEPRIALETSLAEMLTYWRNTP